MNAALLATPIADPLTREHRRELAAAREGATKIRKAARVAAFNGWSTAIVAALSVPFALSSTINLLVAVALIGVAFVEFHGRRRLLKFDPAAATILGWNQLAFLAMICAYCGWMLYSNLNGPNAFAAELEANADLKAAVGMLDGFDTLYRQIVLALYGSVIVLSILFQGGTAIYYFTRRPYIESYVAETPAWIRNLQSGTTAV
jgi:hypothetical protein